MENSQDTSAHRELRNISSSLHSVLDRLTSTTQDVADEPPVKMAERDDYELVHKLSVPDHSSTIGEAMEEMLTICDYRIRMNHPRFMGFIPSPASAYSWLGDTIPNAFNNFASSRLPGSGASMVEKTLIEWLAERVGLPSSAGGLFVSGGSIANLTAMVLARDQILQSGQQSSGVAYLSDQAHTEAIREDRDAGLVPFVVVATCGTTNTGTVDPIPEPSPICKKEGLWLHVDGAYGASAALSKSHSHLTKDLHLADSLAWDGHKWLFQIYDCGIVLVKGKEHFLESFSLVVPTSAISVEMRQYPTPGTLELK
ncbi:Tryptophan decarboxylase [Cladobotryum mycophilum]|uniref:Tryptophan decarboxylase n=1 Tax=Cladobotryum mycophilum TaxID=491253 RepID=A0ABR0SY24_9HYPO